MSKTLAKVRLEIDQGAPLPLGWNADEPWDIWGKILRDKDYWSEQVHVPAIAWTARGRKRKPLSPMQEIADGALRGGHQALQPELEETEGEGGNNRRKNRTRRESQEEKAKSRARRVEQLSQRPKRWRNKGFWQIRIQRWTLRGGVFSLEQQQRFMWRSASRRTLQSKGTPPPPMYGLWITRASFMFLSFEERIAMVMPWVKAEHLVTGKPYLAGTS